MENGIANSYCRYPELEATRRLAQSLGYDFDGLEDFRDEEDEELVLEA